jgi:hypothetical protein
MAVEVGQMVRTTTALLAIATLLSACGGMDATQLAATTICDLVAGNDAEPRQAARVTAVYVTDLRHGSILKDRQCKDITLAVLDAENVSRDSGLKAFDQALMDNPGDLDIRIFLIEVSGTFVRQPDETKRDGFVLEKIWNFRRLQGNDWTTAQ